MFCLLFARVTFLRIVLALFSVNSLMFCYSGLERLKKCVTIILLQNNKCNKTIHGAGQHQSSYSPSNMHKEYQIIIISYLIPMSIPAILPPSFLHLPLCYFLHLCPLPLSPPFQGGLWLPCTKNSFCHLRSAHAILHRCHNKAHTHTVLNATHCGS